MTQFAGTVKKINVTAGKSKKPPFKAYTRYSFISEDSDGQESGWITFGFDPPPFKEGEYIKFEAEDLNGKGLTYTRGSGTIIKNPVPVVALQQAPFAQQVVNLPQLQIQQSGAFDRNSQIVWQHSQEMAISAVAVLLANAGLPTSSAQTKAGNAKRFDEINAYVDKLTVKFYNDALTGRLLATVADPGVSDIKADGPIPAETASTEGDDY